MCEGRKHLLEIFLFIFGIIFLVVFALGFDKNKEWILLSEGVFLLLLSVFVYFFYNIKNIPEAEIYDDETYFLFN